MKPIVGSRRRNRSPFYEQKPRTERTTRRVSFFSGVGRLVVLMILGCIAGLVGAGAQGYIFFTHNLPSIETLRNYTPPIVTHVFADDGEEIKEFAFQRRYVVPIEEIPQVVQDAFVAAEDKNFWKHPGVDKEAIIRAFIQNITKGRIEGGASTITQQVAKTFLLTPERKYSRKIKEALLATQIETSLPDKKQILYLYLNQIFLGSGAYGVEAAARTYFDKSIKDLTIAEAAMLGGLPKAPGKSSPKQNLKRAMERRAYVLKRMREDGCITDAQYEQAMAEEPKIAVAGNPHKRTAPDFTEHVRRYIEDKYGPDMLYKEGLKIYTTVDLEATAIAHEAMEKGLRELDKRQGYRGPLKTLNVKGVMEFLAEKTRNMEKPLQFGDVTEGVVTHIDDQFVYVRMGSYLKENKKREYVGRIQIDPNPKWWVRKPHIRTEMRTRNFAEGDLPFQIGDLILVKVADPNIQRRELYRKKYGQTDPDMKNYKKYTEDMLDYFLLEPEQEPVSEAALMFRENTTGYVRVLLGGRSFSEAKYNRAIQARRQPGSSFKPVIYAAALNKGFTCADIVLDSPIEVRIPGTGEIWRPKNYRGGFLGPISFREAIVKSQNIPTIKILQQITVDHAKAYARKLGYRSPLANNLTMALGSSGVSLEEQVDAYSVFPNKGFLVKSVFVKKIMDRNGRVLEEHNPPVLLDDPLQADKPQIQTVSHDGTIPGASGEAPDTASPVLRRRIDEGTAYILTSLLQDVVQRGTATVLKKIVGRPDLAGKTGTTNDNIDAWFVGFTPDYTCGVWVGFDDERSIGHGETGGQAAAPIWGYFMKELLKNKPVREFPKSSMVEVRPIDRKTGLAASSGEGEEEIFKMGSAPQELEPGLIRGARWDYAGSDLDQF